MVMLSPVLSKFSCLVLVVSCYFCKMYSLMSIVMCMSLCLVLFLCFNCNGLIFTQVNKVLARSLGVCLGEDVVVLAGYTLTSPTFLLIMSHSCHGGCINYFCPITICTLAYANGSPHGHHLHRP